MNVRELRQIIHDLPDDMEVEFGADGDVCSIGASIVVKEWNTLYLGIEKGDLTESMIEWEHSDEEDIGDIDTPADDDEERLARALAASRAGDPAYLQDDDQWPEDREAFLEAMARDQDLSTDCGDVCTVPPPKTREREPAPADTEMM
jgi:hypothetical protein